jgi:hypothetical protein
LANKGYRLAVGAFPKAAEACAANRKKDYDTAMSDDLVYRIFVEIAVLEGKREPGGKWLITDGQEIQRVLKRAFALVARAASSAEEDSPAKKKPA